MQLLITALAVLAAILGGIFTLVVAAVTILGVYLSRRLFGKPRTAIPAAAPRPRPSPRPRTAPGDVIDVTATEVSDSRFLH